MKDAKKCPKVSKKCSKIVQKLSKIVKNCQKLSKIVKNCPKEYKKVLRYAYVIYEWPSRLLQNQYDQAGAEQQMASSSLPRQPDRALINQHVNPYQEFPSLRRGFTLEGKAHTRLTSSKKFTNLKENLKRPI